MTRKVETKNHTNTHSHLHRTTKPKAEIFADLCAGHATGALHPINNIPMHINIAGV